MSALSKSIDVYTRKYENLLFLGDLYAGVEDACVKRFCEPSCIDLILTNCPHSFQNSYVTERGLSDFHKMVVRVMKTTYHSLGRE